MTIAQDWAEKYRPAKLADVVGNNKPLQALRDWKEEWEHGVPEKKAVILSGPAGVGKTSAAHALGNETGWEIIEMNASDQRTAGIIEKVAGSASRMSTLTGIQKRLIILDEADNMHGSADRGGTRAITNVIKKSNQPIILIANDLYALSSTLRSHCVNIKFNPIPQRSILSALKKICKMEGIICGTGVLEKIAENTGGDLRSAIKDLQATATDKKEIEVVDVTTAERDTKESIFKVLTKVFKGMDPVEAYRATFSLDETPEDLIQWVDENLPNQYLDKDETLSEDLTVAYHNLSRADTYLGRVRLRQNYGLWRYAGFLLSGGTAMAKKHSHSGFRKLQPPSMWRRMGQLRSKRNMRDNIAAKVGLHCNEPIRDCRIDLLRMYGLLLKNEDYAVDAAYSLELDVEEIAYLTESKRVTKKIQKIYDASREMMHEKEDEDIDIFMHAPEKDKGQSTLDSMFSAEKDPAEENQMGGKEKDNPKPAKSQKTLFDF